MAMPAMQILAPQALLIPPKEPTIQGIHLQLLHWEVESLTRLGCCPTSQVRVDQVGFARASMVFHGEMKPSTLPVVGQAAGYPQFLGDIAQIQLELLRGTHHLSSLHLEAVRKWRKVGKESLRREEESYLLNSPCTSRSHNCCSCCDQARSNSSSCD